MIRQILSLSLLFVVTQTAFAQKADTKPAPKQDSKPYAVVKMGDEHRVVNEADIDALRADLKKKHADAVTKHKAAAKEAAAKKSKFEAPAPTPITVEVISTKLNKKDADAMLAVLKKKAEAAKQKAKDAADAAKRKGADAKKTGKGKIDTAKKKLGGGTL
ncbi:MAG: hypothetical protein AB8H80_14075 [Planctomycetota bacterium]